MRAAMISDQLHHASLWRAALVGAVFAVILCLIFWATAAAQGMPTAAPGWLRSFQPATGIARLVAGLFWTGVAGAVLATLLAGGYNLARREGHKRHAH